MTALSPRELLLSRAYSPTPLILLKAEVPITTSEITDSPKNTSNILVVSPDFAHIFILLNFTVAALFKDSVFQADYIPFWITVSITILWLVVFD
jgi:hypothetical protein